jgi:hypothetical protein
MIENNYANVQSLINALRDRYIRALPKIQEIKEFEAKITTKSMTHESSPLSESEFNLLKDFITVIKSVESHGAVSIVQSKYMASHNEKGLN